MMPYALCLQDSDIPQVPFEEKLHAIAYINSNCMAESGRSDLMRALMALGEAAKVSTVRTWGRGKTVALLRPGLL